MGLLLYFGGHSHSHGGLASAESGGGGNHGHSHAVDATTGNATEAVNINVRAAFIHVLGDLVQSVGVLIASLIILWNVSECCAGVAKRARFSAELGNRRSDLHAAFLGDRSLHHRVGFLLSVACFSSQKPSLIFSYIIRDALVVLLEGERAIAAHSRRLVSGRPSNIDFRRVFDSLERIPGVRKVHDLRIWALTMNRIAMSAHLEVDVGVDAQLVLKTSTLMLVSRLHSLEARSRDIPLVFDLKRLKPAARISTNLNMKSGAQILAVDSFCSAF